MKDYLIRIEDGHHVVNMKPEISQLEIAMNNAIESLKSVAHKLLENMVKQTIEKHQIEIGEGRIKPYREKNSYVMAVQWDLTPYSFNELNKLAIFKRDPDNPDFLYSENANITLLPNDFLIMLENGELSWCNPIDFKKIFIER